MADFALTAREQDLKDRIGEFVRSKVIPFERDPRYGPHGPSDDLRRDLNALARDAGLLAPHVDPEWGGLGLGHQERAVAFEAAGYSMLGPIAIHCAAPDEGNMHLLEVVASEEQKKRFLAPLAAAETRSCFQMTEPSPGAGSDPSALRTSARRRGNHFVLEGRKWLITGAEGAGFAIVMADLKEGDRSEGATMFLVDMDTPGMVLERQIDSIDSSFTGGHWEVRLDSVEVPAEQVLGEPGQGFRYAQVRLAPARLTHCMRWLGVAQRCQDIAIEYARERMAFGKPIAEHEGVGFMIADNEIDLTQSRLAIRHAAWLLDQGHHGRHETSMVKVLCSEALFRVADRCVQILGGRGLTADTVVERAFRDIRAFRIYDGPSEVHRWSIARRLTTPRREK